MSFLNLSLITQIWPKSVPIPPDPSRSFPMDFHIWFLRNCCKFQICNRQFCEILPHFKLAIVNFAKFSQILNWQSSILRNSHKFQIYNRQFCEFLTNFKSLIVSFAKFTQISCFQLWMLWNSCTILHCNRLFGEILAIFCKIRISKSKANSLPKRSDLERFLCGSCGPGVPRMEMGNSGGWVVNHREGAGATRESHSNLFDPKP